MSEDNATELIKRGDSRFQKRSDLDSFRNELALNFAPQLALWTTTHNLGQDFASHLADGTPLIIADEYVGMIGAMLRPSGKQWSWHRTPHEHLNNNPGIRAYLDWRSTTMMRIIFNRVTGAEGALAESDQFYGLFGDAVLSIDYADHTREDLRVQNHHTKDCVWTIGKDNKPDTITRKESVAARNVLARFSQPNDKLHEKVKEAAEKNGDQEINIRHEVLPAKEYDAYIKRTDLKHQDGWASVWIDADNKCIIRETYQPTFRYVIPRAGRRYGLPYGFSRATMIALPDSRLIQQQALAIMEAAEKQLSPPMWAYEDSIRGDMRLDGITWVGRDWADRKNQPLNVMELGKNFQLGVENMLRTEAQLARAFKLDRLRFPDTRNSKTTQEAAFLIDEFVRSALPIFAPMKVEYNDEFLYECDRLIDIAGGYSTRPKPDELKSVELQFQWDNPLTDMLERQKAQRIAEVSQIGQTIGALEQAASQIPSLQQIDAAKMMREGTIALGAASWLLTEEDAAKAAEATAKAQQMQQMVQAAPNIAQVIDSGVSAATAAATIPNPSEPGYPMLPAPV